MMQSFHVAKFHKSVMFFLQPSEHVLQSHHISSECSCLACFHSGNFCCTKQIICLYFQDLSYVTCYCLFITKLLIPVPLIHFVILLYSALTFQINSFFLPQDLHFAVYILWQSILQYFAIQNVGFGICFLFVFWCLFFFPGQNCARCS